MAWGRGAGGNFEGDREAILGGTLTRSAEWVFAEIFSEGARSKMLRALFHVILGGRGEKSRPGCLPRERDEVERCQSST